MIKLVIVFIVCVFILSCSSVSTKIDLQGEYTDDAGEDYGYHLVDDEVAKTADVYFTHKEKKYHCTVKYVTDAPDLLGVSFKINLDENTGEFSVTYKEVTAGCSLSDI